jgi:glycogen synthase
MEYPPETGGGGIGSYLVSTAPALAARGHEVHVLSCVPGQEHRDYSAQGVSIHRRGLAYIRGLGRLRAPNTAARIRSGLSTLQAFRGLRIPFDAIEYPDWGAEGWAFSLARSAPLLAHLHTPLPLIQQYNGLERNCDVAVASFLERLSVRRADRILSASQLLVTALANIGWLKGRTVDIIPYGIDWARWSHVPAVTSAGPTVLYLGRLEPRKAPEFLVAAIRILRDEISDARAMFVGRCNGRYGGIPYEQWVRRLSADANSGCVYIEQVPRNELPQIFASARVLAMPSRFDSYGMVALEAMAAGRPVVITDTTGAAEIVRGTGGGRVVPAGDAVALADALRPFLRRPDYAQEVGQAAQSTVQTLLDPDRIAAQRAAIYQRARLDATRRG